MEASQKHTRRFADPVGDDRPLLQFKFNRSADEFLWDLEQLFGKRCQLFCRKAAMPLVHGLGQRIGNSGADTDHCRLFDAELHGDRVCGLEANAADIACQAIRVLGHDLDGISAIGLENSYRACRADPIAMQEHHDFPHRLLLGPGGKNAGCTNRPDAIHLAQTLRRRLDDVEHLFAESAHEFLRIYGTNAPDHSRREVFLDTVGRSRRRRAEKPRSELLTVGAVVDPFARGGDPLAGRNGCRMADHGHHIAMPARLARRTQKPFSLLW